MKLDVMVVNALEMFVDRDRDRDWETVVKINDYI